MNIVLDRIKMRLEEVLTSTAVPVHERLLSFANATTWIGQSTSGFITQVNVFIGSVPLPLEIITRSSTRNNVYCLTVRHAPKYHLPSRYVFNELISLCYNRTLIGYIILLPAEVVLCSQLEYQRIREVVYGPVYRGASLWGNIMMVLH